jgi:hypothetical protein
MKFKTMEKIVTILLLFNTFLLLVLVGLVIYELIKKIP